MNKKNYSLTACKNTPKERNFIGSVFLRKVLSVIFIFSAIYLYPSAYPFIYIPGMFDNGDLFNKDYSVVETLNNESGFYFENYFKDGFDYNEYLIETGSSIVDSKYNRLSVANLLGEHRRNISLTLMSERFFSFMKGRASRGKILNNIIRYKGNDFSGYLEIENKNIYFNGIVEEVWAKYGSKVYYSKSGKDFRVSFKETLNYYENRNYYFEKHEDIKFNIVCHSSGGLAVRYYIKKCLEENTPHHINKIINLSVPQNGARMNYRLKDAFPELIDDAINSIYENKYSKSIVLNETEFKYSDLIKKSNLSMLYGDSKSSERMRKIVGDYILYHIPFDGYRGVLGFDPALKDLHPESRYLSKIRNNFIPSEIDVYNYRVTKPYSKMFENVAGYLRLELNDGVVDFRDTDTSYITSGNYVQDIAVDAANHIPFPYIKPLYELNNTIDKFYPFLSILVKRPVKRKDGVVLIEALFHAIMEEFDFNLKRFLVEEDYSVIDYFADNPVKF